MWSVFLAPLWILGVMLLRGLRPFVQIRLGGVNAGRLGHLAIELEMFFSERDCGIHSAESRLIDLRYVWTGGLPISNQLLLDLWKRQLRIGPRVLLQPIDTWNRRIPGGERNAIPFRKGLHLLNQHNDLHGVLSRTNPHLKLSDRDISAARTVVIDKGFDLDSPIVCLHVRDEAYFQVRGAGRFRDDTTRNAQINSYHDAVRYLANEGYTVIRLGATVNTPLELQHPRIWDYATDGSRSELLDIYLPSICSFFISTLSGPDRIALVFRKPIVFTNLAPIKSLSLWMQNSLVIPKRIARVSTGELLSWSEIFTSEIFRLSERELTKQNLCTVENRSDEIYGVVEEMVMRQRNAWETSQHDQELQDTFLNHVPAYLKAGGVHARIGAHFLRDSKAN
jgi:putative glycosyltransferase (TIGR04372 family)